jgi:AMMECR1 domain-containing protein
LGTYLPTKSSLAEEIVANAIAAATRDPRFAPVGPAELAGLQVSVDVLGEPEEVAGVADLDPKRYGLIVRPDDGRQALLLPDLEGIDTAEQQLAVTCRKGGISAQRDRYRLYRFEVRRHE